MSSAIKARLKSLVFWGILAVLPACDAFNECNGIGNPYEPVRAPAISIVPGTATMNVVPGGSTDINVTVKFVDGPNSAELRTSGLLPTGVKVRFEPEIVTVALPTTKMTVIADSTAQPGPLAFEIIAAESGSSSLILVTRARITGAVEKPFTLTAPAAQLATVGTTPEITIGIGRRPGFTSDVGLSVVPGTVPLGTTVRFTSATAGAPSTVLSLVLPETAGLGEYQVRTVGKFGNNQDTVQFAMTVQAAPVPPDITILSTQTSVTAAPGTNATYNLALTRNRTASAIAGNFGLSVVGLPGGAVATFTPTTPRDTARMIVAIPSTVRDSTYRLTITATLGTLVKSTVVDLLVATPPDFTLKLTPAAITVNRGGTTDVVVELQRTGPASNIALDAQSIPSVASIIAAPTIVNATTTTSRLTVAVNALASSGVYNITVRGTSGSLSKTATLVLTIPAPPPGDVSISVLTRTLSVASGGTIQIPIRLTRTGTAVGALLELRSTGVPAGGNAWITPATTFGDSATLNVIGGTVGSYALGVSVVRGTIPPTDTTTVTVTASSAGDFSILPVPQTLSITAGLLTGTSVQIGRTNGFVGAVSFVAIADNLETLVTFGAPSTTANTIVMNIFAGTSVTSGPHVLRIRATSGSIVHEVNMTLNVTVPDTPTYPYPYFPGIKPPPQ